MNYELSGKTKFLLWTIVFGTICLLGWIRSASAQTLEESYAGPDDTSTQMDSTAQERGAYWTTASSYDIYSLKVEVRRQGSPGDLVMNLYACDGAHKPTGTELASKTIASGDIPTVATHVEFIFTTNPTLNASTEYCWHFHASATSGANYYDIYYDSTSTYPNGDYMYSTNSGSSWTVVSGSDVPFEAYSVTAGGGSTPTPTSTLQLSTTTYQIYNPTQDYGTGLIIFLLTFFGIIFFFKNSD